MLARKRDEGNKCPSYFRSLPPSIVLGPGMTVVQVSFSIPAGPLSCDNNTLNNVKNRLR